MDPETLNRAVEPFFTTKGVGKGTGLGLSMVKGTVEQLGGKLTLKSAHGIGTTAELWLPVAEDLPIAQPPRSRVSGAELAQRPLNILVVEDDQLVLLNTTAMLEEMGHRVLEASSGRKALEIFHREPNIDLVLTDQGMPNMTGAELAATIRGEHARTPILLVTGYAELPAGIGTAYPKLSKPFTQDQLAQAVDAAVKMAA